MQLERIQQLGENHLNLSIRKKCVTTLKRNRWCGAVKVLVLCKDFSVLQNPTVQTADLNGNYLNEYHLPVNLNMQKRKKDHAAMAFSKGLLSIKLHNAIHKYRRAFV
jgi:hypothetical protein